MADILATILEAIHGFVGSYGWAIVIFTVLIKLLLLPLEYKSRKGMKQMERLQPQLAALQQKYASDKEKLNQKTAELYQREKINPMSGCLPMLLSMVVLFIMFSAMRQVANMQMAQQTLSYLADGVFRNEGFLWIRNLWMPDSPFAAAMPTASQLATIPAESWAQAYSALSAQQIAALPAEIAFDFSSGGCAATVEVISAYMSALPEYVAAVQTVPQLSNINLFITKLSVFAQGNGWLVLPILSCATQILMTKITQNKAQQNANAQNNQNTKMMNWMMPLFSLFICFGYNASFALYWVVSNVFAIVQTIVLNKILDKKAAA